jgi:hypothetical protein
MGNVTKTLRRAGPLRVTTSNEIVRAFRRETGWREGEELLPASFPVVWMRIPEIGEPIRAAAREIGLPVHEAQQFEYVRPLEIDTSYDLMLEMRREADPDRLIAIAEIYATDGEYLARVVSTLRLIEPDSVPDRGAPYD